MLLLHIGRNSLLTGKCLSIIARNFLPNFVLRCMLYGGLYHMTVLPLRCGGCVVGAACTLDVRGDHLSIGLLHILAYVARIALEY